MEVLGTDLLQSVGLFNGNRLVYSHPCIEAAAPVPNRVLVKWTGARVKSRARQSVWDGQFELDKGRITDVEEFAFETEGLEDELLEVGWTLAPARQPSTVRRSGPTRPGSSLPWELCSWRVQA